MLHWRELKALLGLRVEAPSALCLKQEPLGGGYVPGTLATMLLLELLPYAEELARDWRAYPGVLSPIPARTPRMAIEP